MQAPKELSFIFTSDQVQMKHENVLGTKIKSFNFLKVLGEGAWAIVYEAYDQNTHTNVAVKCIPKFTMKQTPKLEELVRTEIRVLSECHNENVIRFVDSFVSERTQFIAMEFCDGGDLQGYLNTKKRLTEDEATTFLKQILNGFRGLHEVNAMHRDFKVANVLLHQGVCKIADLGFAKQMEKKKLAGTILGTSLTMAPQLLREQKYGMQADIWSVGVVYYQLLYGKYPYHGLSDLDILKKIENTKIDFSGVNLSANAKDFIQRCMTDNPTKRISWREIYDHPLIRSQEKMLYGLTSKINFKQNQQFYNRNIQIKQDYIYAEKKQVMMKKPSHEEIVQNMAKVNTEKLLQQAEEKKKRTIALEKYEKIYLNRRNNIMFIFKFVTPYIYNLYNIKANHGITLFIISKKAYHDMKTFFNLVNLRTNFFKLNPYFDEFTKSPKYQSISQILRSDIQIIQAQLWSYKEDIQYCSKEIQDQFDVQVIRNRNWNGLVQETINSYQFQLGQGLDRVKGEEKRDLIKVVEALTYYKNNSENADIEAFDRKIETIDFQMAQGHLKSKLYEILNPK